MALRIHEGNGPRHRAKKPLSLWQAICIYLTVGLALAFGTKTFLFQVFWVPSSSMESTLQIGDRILVDRWHTITRAKPQSGDIVVFKDPGNWTGKAHDSVGPLNRILGLLQLRDSSSDFLVKRVIATPGDTLECCDPKGRMLLNGKPLQEPYVKDRMVGDITFKVTLPARKYWVMGDNRMDSADSRWHREDPDEGFVDESLIVGRVKSIIWPLKSFELGAP